MNMRIAFCVLLFFGSPHTKTKNNNPNTEPQIMLSLYQLMKDVHELFTIHDIEYSVVGGSLLGAVRHQGIIKWDDDLDILLHKKDEQKFLAIKPLFEQIGYTIKIPVIWNKSCRGYKIHAPKITGVNYKYPAFIDIFLAEEKGNNIHYNFNKQAYFPKEQFYPLKQYQFGEIVVNGPINPIPYLERVYSRHWFSVAQKYNHHISGNIKESLTDADRIPAQPTGPLIDHFFAGE